MGTIKGKILAIVHILESWVPLPPPPNQINTNHIGTGVPWQLQHMFVEQFFYFCNFNFEKLKRKITIFLSEFIYLFIYLNFL
jgi:hypothetical protein